ncbi:FAD-binding oxidoreductase [Oculatella sp. LEGE 06141]|uniref:FAD-binding oxidoreductase n=1 Tax=Oculatella sp. LEGE 06141 TaxID=1828648 RepID=UPI001882D398|nr:FAD-binding oxidoreductase [Oculatella sp. LEGE 06141]MBE9182097.1 FAD-binding oxidoreductase [Oculatella sp. LEGE 06141]
MGVIASQLAQIVGTEGVGNWETVEPRVRSQLSHAIASDSQLDCVVYPSSPSELAEVLACAHQNDWAVLPYGNGSKLHWGGLAANIGLGVSTARLDRLIEHAIGDLTVTVEAGMPFSTLQATLAAAGQFLAIDPVYTDSATVGGVVATADTGSLRQRYGGVRDMVIGLSFVRADGAIAKAGGRVVKNVAGYDLMKLFTGSWGTLGIISQLSLRVYPLPDTSQTVVLQGSVEAIAKATHTVLASGLSPTAVDLTAPQTSERLGIGTDLTLISRFQGLDVGIKEQTAQLLQVGQALDLKRSVYAGADETNLWQRLQHQLASNTIDAAITCKIGVLPAQAAQSLSQIAALIPSIETGLIHAASGLGVLRFSHQHITIETLLEIRNLCQSQGGFLSILEAPISLKHQLDTWGYAGNAIGLMQKIKQQFDPKQLLSPKRFIDSI